jgi:predicted O-methyltransferase YrrM
VLQRGADRLAVLGAAKAVKRADSLTPAEALVFAEEFEYGGVSIRPMQIESEIRAFLELLATDPPRSVLEIGTGRGGTLFLLARAAHENATLVSIDSPEGDASFCGRPAYKRRERLYRALGRPEQRVVYIAADSHEESTRSRVVDALRGVPLDLLFVDGDHTLAGVEADYRMYSPLVRSGGLVAFHDIVPGEPQKVGGVPAFWQQARDEGALELVEDWEQGSCGIGVIRV